MASSSLPLTISGVESNQGGIWLTPHPPSPPPPYCHSLFTSVEAPSASSVTSVYLQPNWERGRLGRGKNEDKALFFSLHKQKKKKVRVLNAIQGDIAAAIATGSSNLHSFPISVSNQFCRHIRYV